MAHIFEVWGLVFGCGGGETPPTPPLSAALGFPPRSLATLTFISLLSNSLTKFLLFARIACAASIVLLGDDVVFGVVFVVLAGASASGVLLFGEMLLMNFCCCFGVVLSSGSCAAAIGLASALVGVAVLGVVLEIDFGSWGSTVLTILSFCYS